MENKQLNNLLSLLERCVDSKEDKQHIKDMRQTVEIIEQQEKISTSFKRNVKLKYTEVKVMYRGLDVVLQSGGILGTGKKYYTDEIIVGIDFPMLSRCPIYEGTEIRQMLDEVTEHTGSRSSRCSCCLLDFSEKHPEFLFAKAKTLSLALHNLDSRAERWNRLSREKQIKLMEDFVKYISEY